MSDSRLTRFEFDGTISHEGGQQFADGKGFAGDSFKRVHVLQPHGLASHPVKGGIGLALSPGRGRDSAYIVGGENPAMRPDIEAGGTAIYDAAGNIVSIVAAQIRIVHASVVIIEAPTVTINGNLEVIGNGTFTGTVTDGDGDGGA